MKSVLNEDALSTISEIIKKEREERKKQQKENGRKYIGTSISKYVNNLTMSFPMMCDSSVPADTATMINIANEHYVAELLKQMFQSMSIKGDDAIEILSSFYKGLNPRGMSAEDMVEFLDRLVDEKLLGESSKSDITIEKAKIRDFLNESVKYLSTPQKLFPVESFSENSVNDFKYYGKYDRIVKEATTRRQSNNDNRPVDTGNDARNSANAAYNKEVRSRNQETRAQREEERRAKQEKDRQADRDRARKYEDEDRARRQGFENNDEIRRQNDEIRKQNDEIRKQAEEARKAEKRAEEKAKRAEEAERAQRDKARREEEVEDRLRDQLQRTADSNNRLNKDILLNNRDIKKQNQMPPTLIQINFVDVVNDGVKIEKSFLAGVKSRLIAVDPSEFVERFGNNATRTKGGKLFNFIKWQTGEISIAKSLAKLFGEMAKDARKNAQDKGASRMWDLLKARSTKNKVNAATRSSNDATSITGIILAQETVNYLRTSYDFDLERPKNAKDIMDAFNLMSIFIADEANEVVKFIYDGNGDYEFLSYGALSKETRERDYKKAINILNQR